MGLGADYAFERVQDNSGMDCGIGIPERRLQLLPTTRYATSPVKYLTNEGVEVQEVSTIAVCRVRVGSQRWMFGR